MYTYQGGKQTIVETENIPKELASESAYKRWENYLSNYSVIDDPKDIIHPIQPL